MPIAANTSAIPISYKCPSANCWTRKYIASRRNSIDPLHATPSIRFVRASIGRSRRHRDHALQYRGHEGNAVAVTYTLNNGYGSGVTVPGLGFLLNDEMDDFAAKPGTENLFHLIQGESNAIQPGKRPVSSMTPTIVHARWQALSDAGRARRIAHHQRRAAGALECRRFPHERAGRRGLAAFPSPMDAGRAVRGEGNFSRYGELLRAMGHKVSPLESTRPSWRAWRRS
jgi:hypothetical protein